MNLNKVFFAVLFLVAFAIAQETDTTITSVAGNDPVTPADAWILDLYNNVSSDGGDSICPDSVNYHGPYRLTSSRGEPMFKGFDLFAQDGCVASGDSLAISYQIIAGDEIADTCLTWTVIDTFTSTGSNGNYTDLSSEIGNSIVFRVYNVDGTGVRIADYIRIVFKKNVTFNENL